MAEVTFGGQQFRMVERVGLMPLMRFAKVAKGGTDSGDMDGLAAMYDLLQAVIDPADWARFEDHAVKVAADDETLMKVVADVFKVLSERPTQRPSDSSERPSTTSTSSPAGSSSAVTLRESQGRADLALVHRLAEDSRASA